MMYGIFNSDSADWTESESLEADFYSVEEAQAAIEDRYSEEDDLVIHEVEEPDEENECEVCGEKCCDEHSNN